MSIRQRAVSFLKSMKLRLFVIILATAGVTAFVFALAGNNISIETSINNRVASVNDYVDKLSVSLIKNVYFSNPSISTDISKELSVAASLYGGRIIVLDGGLKVVFDSYNIEVGKTLVSEEGIRALRGERSEYRDEDGQTIEITMPVKDVADNGRIAGVLIFKISLEECYTASDVLKKGFGITGFALAILAVIFAIWVAEGFTKPFKAITDSIHHVSEGYIEDKVEIRGFTETERISDSLNEMLGRISRLEESRQEFVSNVSHELKTPLTSMKVLAESLTGQGDVPIELYREFMSDISEQIDRENSIISDLLALVKLDRKTGDMHIASVSINEMIEIVLKRLKPIAQSAGIDLVFESYRDVLAEVDEMKLSLAIMNLIENGIKYNRENGSVTVTLNSDHRFFTIKIADTGIGIPEDSIEQIFDRFYRVDKTRSRETGGTGLGLAITKSVVLMHNGSIRVESTEGEGTEFTVRIPLSYIPGARG